jgi:hypothetical protein
MRRIAGLFRRAGGCSDATCGRSFVFNGSMKKRSLALCAALAAATAALAAVPAYGAIIELGATKTPLIAPTCPPNSTAVQCTIIQTRATALETIRDGITYPTTVRRAGRIVAFTVGLSALSANRTTRLNDIKFLDHTYGGTTQVAISVLAPSGAKKLRQWKLVAESPLFHVQPYLGEVVQLPLQTTLPVQRGDVVALTTPTWAPTLSIDLSSKQFAYRQSRKSNCPHPPSGEQAQMTLGATARYGCDYPGTRVEYSATEITTPAYPKNYVHSRRKG